MATTRPRVYCRIRPLNQREEAAEQPRVCFFDEPREPDALLYRTVKDESIRSRFDEVFGVKTQQTQVHSRLRTEVMASLFSGYNATVFAYGQTGSGKTFTMEGPKPKDVSEAEFRQNKGLVPRLLEDIFKKFESEKEYENCSLTLSYVQVYQDQVQDLLQARKNLEIRLDKSGHYVANGALWRDVRTVGEAMTVYHEAGKNRATNSTDMNLVSSRSHALLQLQLQWDEPMAPGSNAKLNLVDLAGSEKVSLSGATGEKLKEAIAINKSLSSLSNVVKALVEQARDPAKRHHVPYKDSKLTYLLQSSLGGSNLVHFVLCISASTLFRNESQNTIEFGKRALRVLLKPVKNAIDYKRLEEMERMIEQMRKHISELEGKLADKDRQQEEPQGGEESGFLQMEAIRQPGQPGGPETDDGGGENDAYSQQKDSIRKAIAELEEQRKTVENRLTQRDRELQTVKGSSAREQRALQQRLESERARHAQELSTLQSNVDAQHARLKQMEDDILVMAADRKQRAKRRNQEKAKRSRSLLQRKTHMELDRIYKNLPESLHELTSHCILFPQSKARFRELGGVKKLVGYVDSKGHKGLESYKAHAAYALSIVLEEQGREDLCELGGLEALAEVLDRPDEHSKQFSCRALESAVRGNPTNKSRVGASAVLKDLVSLVGVHPNQQVQEAACSALAEIADGQPGIKARLRQDGLLKKMISLIRDTPVEVADLIKIGVSVIGRLAQQDTDCQREIAKLDGVAVLTKILFSPVGDKDPQLPVLTAYALVNLCCSNKTNMAQLQKHPQYPEIRFKLLEGLGRVFVDNIVAENRERATASHTIRDGGRILFSYHGVTCQGEWGAFTAGGRPTYSTFLENPQFALSVHEDCSVSIVISDVDYETRLRSRVAMKTKTIYMGIAVFRGDQDLCQRGLKQLDFNGRFVTSGRFNRNRENTLSLTLQKSPDPYIIVPFTAHSLQHTRFALSVFADSPVELTHLPEEGSWMKRVVEGRWTPITGRGVDSFDWRNTDQFTISVTEPTEVVAVLSYRSLDEFRRRQALVADEDEVGEDDAGNEERKERPHLHGRVFKSTFAGQRRFVRSNIPSPQNSSFVACNEYLSTSCVKTAATLQPGVQYVYIPSTETPHTADYRVAFYCDKGDVSISPLRPQSEWYTFHHCGQWKGGAAGPSNGPALLITGTGDIALFGLSKDVYLRITLYEIVDEAWASNAVVTPSLQTQKLCSTDAFWAQEGVLETTLPAPAKGSDRPRAFLASLEGITTSESGEQHVADKGDFTFALYAADISVSCVADLGGPGDLQLVNRLNAGPETVSYGWEKMAFDDPGAGVGEADDEDILETDSDGEGGDLREELAETKRALEEARMAGTQASSESAELVRLRSLLDEKQQMIDSMSQGTPATPVTPHLPQPPTDSKEPLSRQGSLTRKGSALSRRSSMSKGKPTPKKSAPAAAAAGAGQAAVKGLKDDRAAKDEQLRRMEAEVAALRATADQQAAAGRVLTRRLSALAARDGAPTADEWRRIRHELAEAAAQLQSGRRAPAP
eukprot:TRINITY_DN1424_c0_g2_i1.p1 TRINITY_DN1424_c0_g2~~TRINITY_DN1424_c0_g2_i1.p1  ORF type:complete len:1559 (+),score=685.68 TRINITY_DN1424_c0_g2_i1:64-4677(+)